VQRESPWSGVSSSRALAVLPCGQARRLRNSPRTGRVGISLSGKSTDANTRRMFAAFREGMRSLGWIEGQDVHYEVFWGGGNREKIEANAAELVKAAPDASLTVGTPATAPLRRKTGTMPIVFAVVSDPAGDGLVASLSHPSGNVTGFITFYPASTNGAAMPR